MNTRLVALCAMAVLASSAAKADIVFDSLNVANNTYQYDGVYDGTAAMAVSFDAGAPDFSILSVSMLLGASADGGTGSSMVYLVPDDQSVTGGAGNPNAAYSAGEFTGFTGAQLIGTINDSSLAVVGDGATTVSFSFTPTVTSANGEYWIGIVPADGSTLVWYYGADNTGIGTANQSNWYADTPDTSPPAYVTFTDDNIVDGGPYDLTVDTPEPDTFAVVGAGLALLGLMRLRNRRV